MFLGGVSMGNQSKKARIKNYNKSFIEPKEAHKELSKNAVARISLLLSQPVFAPQKKVLLDLLDFYETMGFLYPSQMKLLDGIQKHLEQRKLRKF